jgi:hypothetical protein
MAEACDVVQYFVERLAELSGCYREMITRNRRTDALSSLIVVQFSSILCVYGFTYQAGGQLQSTRNKQTKEQKREE